MIHYFSYFPITRNVLFFSKLLDVSITQCVKVRSTVSWVHRKLHSWAIQSSNVWLVLALKFLCFSLTVYLMLSVVHGSQATPVYTLMLRCSQNAPQSVQTTCYSFLGTLEILGKQFSLFIAGVLTEALGYVAGLYISLVVSFFVVILVWHCPKYLRCP